MECQHYKKELNDVVSKDYRKMLENEVKDIDKEAAILAREMNLADRIDTMGREVAFLTVKDHKPDFPNRVHYRLINPAKPQMGKLSKIILARINKDIIQNNEICQWISL